MPKTAKKPHPETRQEEQARKLAEIGKTAYDSIAEIVAGLEAVRVSDDGQDDNEPDQDARDAARTAIEEDPLSVQVRSGWYSPGARREDQAPEEFEILLATGGPAVRIMGELNASGEPSRAWLETQDWGTAWTQYFQAEQSVLIDYCRVFSFGE